MVENYAELIMLGAATLTDQVLIPKSQAMELGLSLLPEEWLEFMSRSQT
jgi:hypothetical protein